MKAHFENISGGTLLIIHNEPDMALLMKIYFLRRGCKVFIAHTVEDALDSAGRLSPDCVIADLPFPENKNAFVQPFLGQAPGLQLIICNREIIYDKQRPFD